MNTCSFATLPCLVLMSSVLGLAACASTPKELTLAEQIRARADLRVEVAKTLDDAEAKLAKAQQITQKAAALDKEAAELEQRANDTLKKVKKMREESAELTQQADTLSAEGNAAMTQAAESYKRVNELPQIELPVVPATPTKP